MGGAQDLARRSRERGPRIRAQRTCLIRGVITVGSYETWRIHTRRSRGGVDHQALIKHVLKLRRYNGHDLIFGGASDASDQEPTAWI